MEKYINELLTSASRVIVPDFGAFIIRQKNPRLVVFNEFLRYNDGQLVNYIVAQEKISADEAKKKLDDFVKDLQSAFSSKGEFTFSGLGTLVKEPNGKLAFKEQEAGAAKPKTTGPSTETKSTDKTAKPEKKEEDKTEKPEPKKEPEIKKEEKTATEKTEDNTQKEPAKTQKPVSSAAGDKKEKTGPSQEKKEPVVLPQEKKTVSSYAPPPKSRISTSEQRTTKETKQKSTFAVWPWIIILLVAGSLLFVYIKFFRTAKTEDTENVLESEDFEVWSERVTSEIKDSIETGSEGFTAGQEQASPPEVLKETAVINQQQSIAKKPTIESGIKKYYIVAGCFRDENNADAYVQKLNTGGFPAEKFGKIGNLYAVSFNSFTDKSQAIQELRKIRKNQEAEAWLIYY